MNCATVMSVKRTIVSNRVQASSCQFMQLRPQQHHAVIRSVAQLLCSMEMLSLSLEITLTGLHPHSVNVSLNAPSLFVQVKKTSLSSFVSESSKATSLYINLHHTQMRNIFFTSFF